MSLQFIVILLSLFAGHAVAASANKSKPPPVVEVMGLQSQASVMSSIQTMGTLRASESISLKPEVAGKVLSIGFVEGQLVRKGQLLVKLDESLLSAELAGKEASVLLAEAELRRLQELARSQQVAEVEVERKRAEVALTKSNLSLLKARLQQTELKAPFSGVIGIRQFSVGEFVQPGQSLVNLSSSRPLKVDIKLPEGKAAAIKVGQEVTVRTEAIQGLQMKGRVTAIEPQLDAGTRALWVRIVLDGADSRLKSGMTATVAIPVPASGQALWVPEQALVAQGGKLVIFKVSNGMAVATPVKSGQRLPGKVEITQGLMAGDTIVISGQNKLSKPEMPIKAVPATGAW